VDAGKRNIRATFTLATLPDLIRFGMAEADPVGYD
jgi:hypothetical protein